MNPCLCGYLRDRRARAARGALACGDNGRTLSRMYRIVLAITWLVAAFGQQLAVDTLAGSVKKHGYTSTYFAFTIQSDWRS